MLKLQATTRRGSFLLDVHIDVDTPGIIALFGRSGCGKTTLVNIIAGLLRADRALIAVDGVVLESTADGVQVPPERRRIGYVFQDARLFPHLNVQANLQYGERRAPPGERRIGADKVIALLNLGELLQRRTRDLSGGERQRVALGRALLSQPRLLLLDEPLASLDAERREEVLPYLENLRDEFAMPMVYVSHQFDEVLRLASHIVLMDKGSVVAQGGVQEISLHPQLRAIVGTDAVGAVVTGSVVASDPVTNLVAVQVGDGVININLPKVTPGARVRVQVLARDVILATHKTEGLSVRNELPGIIAQIVSDDEQTDMIHIDVGGAIILARITRAASSALSLRPGLAVWALVKAVSIRGHAFRAPR